MAGVPLRNAGRGHCTAPHTGARGATVQCHLATLKAGAAWRVHITVTVKASTGILRDQANITSGTPGPRTGSNTATATTKITTKITS